MTATVIDEITRALSAAAVVLTGVFIVAAAGLVRNISRDRRRRKAYWSQFP